MNACMPTINRNPEECVVPSEAWFSRTKIGSLSEKDETIMTG